MFWNSLALDWLVKLRAIVPTFGFFMVIVLNDQK